MKVYLINLDGDKNRLMAADGQLKSLSVDYERIPAVYGKDLSNDEKRKAVSYFRWWCAVGVPPRDGEIGCALSHLKAYEMLLKSGESCCCVLEDDVVLDGRFVDVLSRVEKCINKNIPQVILLSNHSDPDVLGEHVSGYRSSRERSFEVLRCHRDAFTEGYVLTAVAAKALIRQNAPVKIFADAWTRWDRIGAIELYHAFPTVCSQNKDGFQSHTILNDSALNVAHMPLRRWVWHKFKRVIGVTLDKSLVAILGR